MKKKYRVYFNRLEGFPQIWSLDEGSPASEICVCNIVVDGPICKTKDSMTADSKFSPKAWFEIEGILTISEGTAYFRNE